jgi:hypothetical protein
MDRLATGIMLVWHAMLGINSLIDPAEMINVILGTGIPSKAQVSSCQEAAVQVHGGGKLWACGHGDTPLHACADMWAQLLGASMSHRARSACAQQR